MSDRRPNDVELRRLHEVAAEYREKGYKVVISPVGEDLPAFLRDLDVDLLAKNKREGVVVLVRTRDSLAGSKDLTRVAQRVEGRQGWRLELVVAAGGPVEPDSASPNGIKPLRIADIEDRLEEAAELDRRGHREAAFLLAWAAAEAAMRAALSSAGLPVERPTALTLAKTLYSYGLVTKADYDSLIRYATTRNAVAHGFKPEKPNRTAAGDLIQLVDRLMRIDVRVEA